MGVDIHFFFDFRPFSEFDLEVRPRILGGLGGSLGTPRDPRPQPRLKTWKPSFIEKKGEY